MRTEPVVIILGMAIATYATRVGGPWLMERVRPTPRLESLLRHLPGAILISIVAPIIGQSDARDLVAVVATVVAGFATRNLLLSMVIGVTVVYLMRNFL